MFGDPRIGGPAPRKLDQLKRELPTHDAPGLLRWKSDEAAGLELGSAALLEGLSLDLLPSVDDAA